jgi:hypothetical protein
MNHAFDSPLRLDWLKSLDKIEGYPQISLGPTNVLGNQAIARDSLYLLGSFLHRVRTYRRALEFSQEGEARQKRGAGHYSS